MALITGVYALAGFPVDQFSNYIFGLVTAAGIYSGTAAAEKFAPSRAPAEPL